MDISLVADIRDLPLSRRNGFSKNVLAAALKNVGIEYIHLKALGDPKEGREAARTGDLDRFRKVYSRQIATEAAKNDLAKIVELSKNDVICLLCYERDPETCHRKIVAQRLSDTANIEIRHIGVREGIASKSKPRTSSSSRQSTSTRRG